MKITEKQKKVFKGWIENLRSGKFKQGTVGLFNQHHIEGDQFCCLGVLAYQSQKTEEQKEVFKEICSITEVGYIFDMHDEIDYSGGSSVEEIIVNSEKSNLPGYFEIALAALNDGLDNGLNVVKEQTLIKVKKSFPSSYEKILQESNKRKGSGFTFNEIADYIEKDYLQ